ncbi:tetratricopeptide repeat protein [Candidatus Margulisiibacteriota bacterium]
MKIKVFCIVFLFSIIPIFSASFQEADDLFYAAKSLYERGDYAKALTKYLSAVRIDERLGKERGSDLYNDYIQVANCYGRLEKPYLQKKYLIRALCLAIQSKNMHQSAKTYNKLGVFFYKQEDYLDALKSLKQSIYQLIGSSDEKSKSIFGIAKRNYFRSAYKLGQSTTEAKQWLNDLRKRPEKRKLQADFIERAQDYNRLKKYSQAFKYFLKSAEVSTELDDYSEASKSYFLAGKTRLNSSSYKSAFKYFNKAVKVAQQNYRYDLIPLINKAYGDAYITFKNDYAAAIKKYKRIISIDECMIDQDILNDTYNQLASACYQTGKSDQALAYYKKALKSYQEREQYKEICVVLNNIGWIYYLDKEYKQAEKYYEQALSRARSMDQKPIISAVNFNLGLINKDLQKYDESLAYFKNALKEVKDNEKKALILNNMGDLYRAWGDNDSSLAYYKKAYPILEALGNGRRMIKTLKNISTTNKSISRYDKSKNALYKALLTAQNQKITDEIVDIYISLGDLEKDQGNFLKAVDYLDKALGQTRDPSIIKKICKKLDAVSASLKQYKKGRKFFGNKLKDSIAANLHDLGVAYLKGKQYNQAIERFKEALELKDQLQKAAKPEFKTKYLASQLTTFQVLTTVYLRANQPEKAFNCLETASTKKLVNQSRLTKMGIKIEVVDIKGYQSQIEEHIAIINYANIDTGVALKNKKAVKPIQLVADNKNVFGYEMDPKVLIKKSDKNDFLSMVSYYSELSSKLTTSKDEKKYLKKMGRELYKYLFENVEKHIKSKKELIIIRDGILMTLPFERLIMPDGRYLNMKYKIKYIPSLSVSGLINNSGKFL